MAICGYFYKWLLLAIFLVIILLVAICGYFYKWLLLVILLMGISNYFIGAY
jgi:hypothetical protein